MEKNFRENMKAFYTILAKNRAKNFIILILLITTLFGAYQYNRAIKLRRELNNAYNRAFYELTGYVQNVEIMLMKALMTSSPQLASSTMRDIWQQANLASTNLGQLPVAVGTLANTEKFLSQVSDLSQSISKLNTAGQAIDEEQLKTLASLHKFAVTLDESLVELKSDLSNGNFKWENISDESAKTFSSTSEKMPDTFGKIDETFQEFPTLIYDGPFSEHMARMKALGLSGEKVDESHAISSLSDFLGKDNVDNVEKKADNKNGIIDTYNFYVKMSNHREDSLAQADVSMTGGKVVWYLYNREVGTPSIDIAKAKQQGMDFLKSRGYKNMKDTYYLETGGVATINYAYYENDILYYPDLVKVKVALDNGEVVGFEAKGFLMSHRERTDLTPEISETEAREKVTRGEDITSAGLVVIPTDYGTEILCYEFKGKLEDKYFLVYINAKTGQEEKVLLIIDSESGILTM